MFLINAYQKFIFFKVIPHLSNSLSSKHLINKFIDKYLCQIQLSLKICFILLSIGIIKIFESNIEMIFFLLYWDDFYLRSKSEKESDRYGEDLNYLPTKVIHRAFG